MGYETDLTPDMCLHEDLDDLPDGSVCNECFSIIYNRESPIVQEMPHSEYLPKDGDLEEVETKY
jgi:hypothetical protein